MTGENRGEWRVQERSSLAGDDAKSDPYQVSHAAWHALTVAVDHLSCLRSSLSQQMSRENTELSITVHIYAPSTLLRGAFENAARAVWLLGPGSRAERIRRRLAMQAGEVRNSARLWALMGRQPPRSKEDRIKQLAELLAAADARLSAEEAGKAVRKVPDYAEIVRDAGARTSVGADLAEVIWKGCSALAHGDMYGTLSMLALETIERRQNTVLTQVTASISGLYSTTMATTTLIERGFELYKQRGTRYL
ncbi:hypothetical protein CLV72_108245 [Allonocardiopsis opalescens]|uniref:Uncharacterized protein n=2 Tax=Allonocardiopsis opalescens TaxID=1144618 RepID=A0A2T0PXR2_9ACTN|nr:hypothetical protein CLV72_108245 [Allonocardiopsis opalescens]